MSELPTNPRERTYLRGDGDEARLQQQEADAVQLSTYAETLAWLYTLEAARGMDFKLERVALALKALGEPQRAYPSIHVAGTNGKGSVSAMLHAILLAAGQRVGLYTSPHLVRFTERIRIGHDEISEPEVVSLTQEIRAAATVRGIELTFFEFVTVIALLAFARHGVDCAILEVGLGGRLDATNVIDPEVAVITTIGRDHEQYLGDTLEGIAVEKGGIIKKARPVVLGRMPGIANSILREIADGRLAPVLEAHRELTVEGTGVMAIKGLGWEIDEIRLGLRGAFQRENAVTALAAAALIRERFGLTADSVRAGLRHVQWPGRLDVIATKPTVILDGAHNPDGIAALLNELPTIVGDRPRCLLYAVMGDKRWRPMVEQLAPTVQSATITTVLPPRGQAPEPVAEVFRHYCPADIIHDPTHAAAELCARLPAEAVMLVTGSLFLVGAVYPLFQKRRVLASAALHP